MQSHIKKFCHIFTLACLSHPVLSRCYGDTTFSTDALFQNLEIVADVNREINDRLPFFYNYNMVGGYFNMPSAKMNEMGVLSIGGARVVPFNIWGVNITPFSRMEISGNYRVYTGEKVDLVLHHFMGDYTDKAANVKFGLYVPEDGISFLPKISYGINDFTNSSDMLSQYIVATKEFLPINMEFTLGYGSDKIKGWFGGVAWTPLRNFPIPLLNSLSILAEYDKYDYNKQPSIQPEGRTVHSRINWGMTAVLGDFFQASASSLRGNKIAFSGSVRYPLGTTQGFFKKTFNPTPYSEPTDTESLGVRRPEAIFAHELAYAFSDQRIELYSVYLVEEEGEKRLWIKVVNNDYRQEEEVRNRVQAVLSHLLPRNIDAVTVVVEFDGVVCQQYHYRGEDLRRYLANQMGKQELDTVAPLEEATNLPKENTVCLFKRRKAIWSFLARPRFQTFFGSNTGKFKYNVGLIASPEGYIADQVYWKMQLGYSIKSTTWDMSDVDPENPSQLPNVRTDTINYYKSNSVSFEEGYLQKSWNLGKGFFTRFATGYFEPAYGGGATELLYYPVDSSWAISLQAATVLKRHYEGLGFTTQIRKFNGDIAEYIHFIGYQYFVNLYYNFAPLNLDFEMKAGQFLARDVGFKSQLTRTFPNGLKMGVWFTLTNAHDQVNGKTYFDKGFSFSIPLDFFLRKSSKKYLGYAVSAWLRDSGAVADTGKVLYPTIREQRD